MTVRQEKVQEQLVQELSELIQSEVRDPRVGFVTLTGAEISRDLRHAKVYVSIMGNDEARKLSLRALNGASGMLRGEFARRAHLRVAPELEFRFDEGIERGAHIFELLNSVQADLKPRPEETAADGSAVPVSTTQEAEKEAEKPLQNGDNAEGAR